MYVSYPEFVHFACWQTRSNVKNKVMLEETVIS